MGICCSKSSRKKRKDYEACCLEKPALVSRDPPPTESEIISLQEEKVKEVLSETVPRISAAAAAAAAAKSMNNNNKVEMRSESVGVINTPSASEASTATTLTERTRTALAEEYDDEEEDGEERSYGTRMMNRKKKAITKPALNNMNNARSRSPAKADHQKKKNQTLSGGRNRREVLMTRSSGVVDVGCTSGRRASTPSPAKAMFPANKHRRNVSSSSTPTSTSYCKGTGNSNGMIKKGDPDIGERSGRRSLSPAMKRRPPPAEDNVDQRRHCRSLSAAIRSSPQKRLPVPLKPPSLHLLESKAQGQDCNNNNSGDADEEVGVGKESLENPLVSMECFIFL